MRAGTLVWAGALAAACSSGLDVDQDEFCRLRPDDYSCPQAGGSAGAAGKGGGGSAGRSGSDGGGSAGRSGSGGGGTGGGTMTPCKSDSSCVMTEGPGSLCVGGACTKGSATCSSAALVVVAEGRDPTEAALVDACHFRDLASALAATTSGTKRLAVYADEASAPAPLALGEGVAFDGHAADPTKPVALTVATPVANTPLVTLAAGASLAGVALDGSGTIKGIAVSAGSATLAGPLTVAATTLALELTGEVKATVTGTLTAPVRFTNNARGVVVGASAGLTVQGEGATGVVIENTTGGAGVLLEKGTGGVVPTSLERVVFRGNLFSSVVAGTGALEVRQSRQITIKACVFENNRQSLTLGGGGDSPAGAFLGVSLLDNNFSAALPAAGGSVVCGSNLSGQAELNVGGGNVFPGEKDCTTLGAATFGCNDAQLLGFDAPGNEIVVDCL